MIEGRIQGLTRYLDGLFVMSEYTENLELALGTLLLGLELSHEEESLRLYEAVKEVCYMFGLTVEILKGKAQQELERENERAKLPQLDEWRF